MSTNPQDRQGLTVSQDHAPSIGSVTSGQSAITWRGISRIEYSHDELLGLAESVTRNTHGDLHNIVTAFNDNTLIRLISQADLAIPSSAKQVASECSRDANNE